MAKQRGRTSTIRHAEAKPLALKVISDRCQVLSADSVGVALGPREVSLSFYVTIPDPSNYDEKRPVRYALAVVQLPVQVAAQLPRLMNQILLDRLDLAQVSPGDVDAVTTELQAVADAFRAKVERTRREQETKDPDNG